MLMFVRPIQTCLDLLIFIFIAQVLKLLNLLSQLFIYSRIALYWLSLTDSEPKILRLFNDVYCLPDVSTMASIEQSSSPPKIEAASSIHFLYLSCTVTSLISTSPTLVFQLPLRDFLLKLNDCVKCQVSVTSLTLIM